MGGSQTAGEEGAHAEGLECQAVDGMGEAVPVGWHCCNKMPQMEWLKQQKCTFSCFWKLESKMEMPDNHFHLLETALLDCTWPPSQGVFMWPFLKTCAERESKEDFLVSSLKGH